MIVKVPTNKYEKEIYNILDTNNKYSKMPPGERAILYDLATQDIPKYVSFHWEDLDLNKYIHNIKLSYDKTKNLPGINVVKTCINNIFPNIKVDIEGASTEAKLVIKDISIS